MGALSVVEQLRTLGRSKLLPAAVPCVVQAARAQACLTRGGPHEGRLGKLIVEKLSEVARGVGCYKVILDCSADTAHFYEHCGFVRKEVQMAQYFSR